MDGNPMLTQRYPHMLHEYFVDRVRTVMDERRARVAALKTKADAEAYVRSIRRRVRKAFGPLPKKTPLNARVTGRAAYDGYALERVVFESRPDFPVTGNLYIPDGVSKREKAPCVLGLCGHSPVGKAEPFYQMFCQGLARKGFVVFIIDPVCQGERRQFFPEDGGSRPGLCAAHNLLGNQLALVYGFFGAWRVHDAIRGLDYLLGRDEVDRRHIGVTGNSGGGTLTTWLTALDKRPTMVAPSCFVTSWLSNLESELPADSEQNPPRALALGLDEADLLCCYAPRPTIILSQQDDFFAPGPACEMCEDMRRIHRLLGSRDSADIFVGPHSHGFYKENREAMYGFFLKHAGLSGDASEPDVADAPPEELFAVESGEARGRRLFEFTAAEAKRLKKTRGKPSADAVRKSARTLLAMPRVSGAPHARSLYGYWEHGEGVRLRRQFAVETEPGIQAIVTTWGEPHGLMHPPRGKITLYVPHVSSADDMEHVEETRKLAERGTLVTVDPRGMGESLPKTCGSTDFFDSYGSDFLYASTADMLGEPLLGRRVFDVMRTTDFLLADGADEVRLVGRGLGSVITAFTALLHDSEPTVRLFHYLPSFEMIAATPIHRWPLSILLRGVLTEFDLPDVYRVLGKRCSKRAAWDASMQPTSG